MLTRKNTRPQLDYDEMERRFNLSAKEEVAEDAKLDRELAAFEREHDKALHEMSLIVRYRYERCNAVRSCLRSRDRMDTFCKLFAPDSILRSERLNLRKHQHALVQWRQYLRTGVLPSIKVN